MPPTSSRTSRRPVLLTRHQVPLTSSPDYIQSLSHRGRERIDLLVPLIAWNWSR